MILSIMCPSLLVRLFTSKKNLILTLAEISMLGISHMNEESHIGSLKRMIMVYKSSGILLLLLIDFRIEHHLDYSHGPWLKWAPSLNFSNM